MAKIGYVRVSTTDQNPARQLAKMAELGVEKIFQEKISGAKSWSDRPALRECLTYIREGDTIYIDSITRLGRGVVSSLEALDIIDKKGCFLISFKESIDSKTVAGRFMINVLVSMAQFEREQIRENQLEGIAQAKLDGKYKGRSPKQLPDFERIASLWRDKKCTVVKASRQLGISRATFYKKIKELDKLANSGDGVQIGPN